LLELFVPLNFICWCCLAQIWGSTHHASTNNVMREYIFLLELFILLWDQSNTFRYFYQSLFPLDMQHCPGSILGLVRFSLEWPKTLPVPHGTIQSGLKSDLIWNGCSVRLSEIEARPISAFPPPLWSGWKPCLLPSRTIDGVVWVTHMESLIPYVNKPGWESSHDCRTSPYMYVLTTKIDRITILPARSVSQTGQTGPLD
jgi:hypothetical protein